MMDLWVARWVSCRLMPLYYPCTPGAVASIGMGDHSSGLQPMGLYMPIHLAQNVLDIALVRESVAHRACFSEYAIRILGPSCRNPHGFLSHLLYGQDSPFSLSRGQVYSPLGKAELF